MEARQFIGMFDSGLGGLSVWRELACLLPQQPILYLADQAHVPYGSRSLEQVREFAVGITEFLHGQGANVIVLASNTTSAAALYHLRARFPVLSFVGMEPAIKPAVEQTKSQVVGVIATQATFQGELFANLRDRYAGKVRVLTQACPGLVEAVEQGQTDAPETINLLRKYLSPMIQAGMDQLVLGCTHYPFLRPAIEQVIGPGVQIIDPAPAVARQAKLVLSQTAPSNSPCVQSDKVSVVDHRFYTSGDAEVFCHRIQKLLGTFTSDSPDVRSIAWCNDQLIVV